MKTMKLFVILTVSILVLGVFGCVSTSGGAAVEEIVLYPTDATIHSDRAVPQLEVEKPNDNLGYWHNTEEYVTWDVDIQKTMEYMITMRYAAWGENAGSSFLVEIGGQEIPGTFVSTSEANDGYFAWKDLEIGKVTLEAGAQVLTLKVTKIVKEAAANILELRIIPAK